MAELEQRREIRRVKQANEDELLQRPGVTGVDIDYKVTDGERTDSLSIVFELQTGQPIARSVARHLLAAA